MDALGDDGMNFDMQSMAMSQQPQIFGNYAHDGSQVPGMQAGSMYPDDAALGAGEDTNDAKRRRIARVGIYLFTMGFRVDADSGFRDLGLRHVPEEEDQMRWEDAQVFALYQLQDGLRFHTG